jgi:RNA polymerase sigma-70 factor (ECF subfamily)
METLRLKYHPGRIFFQRQAVLLMEGYSSESRSGAKDALKRREESRLIERAIKGDKRAIGELYRAHVDTIYSYIFARVQDAAIAEDLTAQVFLKALEGLPSYEPGNSPFLAWLYRIAHARTVDYWRQQQRRNEVLLDETLRAASPQPEELLEFEAEWSTALDLLAQLTDDQQDVLILRFVGDMSLSEVAETLGKTVGAVKAAQHRALATLARLMQGS